MTTTKLSFSFERFWPFCLNTLRRHRSSAIFYTVLSFVFLTLPYVMELIDNSYSDRAMYYMVSPGLCYNAFSAFFFTALSLVTPVIDRKSTRLNSSH